jgi:hypothetical protein
MQNVTLDLLYNELLYIHKKIDRLEHILIPEVEMTEEEKKELAEAKQDVKEGNVVEFEKIRKD